LRFRRPSQPVPLRSPFRGKAPRTPLPPHTFFSVPPPDNSRPPLVFSPHAPEHVREQILLPLLLFRSASQSPETFFFPPKRPFPRGHRVSLVVFFLPFPFSPCRSCFFGPLSGCLLLAMIGSPRELLLLARLSDLVPCVSEHKAAVPALVPSLPTSGLL